MLTFRLQGPSLIKERSSRPPDQDPLVTRHSHLIGSPNLPTLPISLLTSQGLPSCFGMCVLMTHIGSRCIQCVVIVLHLSSWSDDPHLFLSSFNPYLSDPLTLPLLIHLSHNVVSLLFSPSHNIIIVLLILGELSHYLVTVTRHTSHTLVLELAVLASYVI